MLQDTKGIVLRVVAVGDKDKLLTVLSFDLGLITVSAKGARSIKNPNMSSTQIFCYSNFVLYKKGDYYWLRESDLIEGFFGIHGDVEKCALAAYICNVAEEFAVAEDDAPIVGRMTLNALYAIANSKAPLPIIKGAYEMRIASESGFMPNLVACAECAAYEADPMIFDIMNGEIVCGKCRKELDAAQLDVRDEANPDIYESLEPVIRIAISPGTLAALRYAVYGKQERLYSFALADDALGEFSAVCETYLLSHIGRSFQTLDFYKSIIEG